MTQPIQLYIDEISQYTRRPFDRLGPKEKRAIAMAILSDRRDEQSRFELEMLKINNPNYRRYVVAERTVYS